MVNTRSVLGLTLLVGAGVATYLLWQMWNTSIPTPSPAPP